MYFITVNKYRFCLSVIGYINMQITGIVIKNQYRSITNENSCRLVDTWNLDGNYRNRSLFVSLRPFGFQTQTWTKHDMLQNLPIHASTSLQNPKKHPYNEWITAVSRLNEHQLTNSFSHKARVSIKKAEFLHNIVLWFQNHPNMLWDLKTDTFES